MGLEVYGSIKKEVGFMKELAGHVELEGGGEGIRDVDVSLMTDQIYDERVRDLRGDDGEMRLMRMSLARFLEETVPVEYRAKQWGALGRRRMSDGLASLRRQTAQITRSSCSVTHSRQK